MVFFISLYPYEQLFHLYPVNVDERELGGAVVVGQDSGQVDFRTSKDGRVDLLVGKLGITAGTHLDLGSPGHLEVLADRISGGILVYRIDRFADGAIIIVTRIADLC